MPELEVLREDEPGGKGLVSGVERICVCCNKTVKMAGRMTLLAA
jgi:hypothetical protein